MRTNKIPRQVPEQPWYMHPAFSILIGGILPFGAVFIELFFILTSMWLHQFYYLFGFLGLVFIILIITCAEITIVLTYFQLCSGAAPRACARMWRGYLLQSGLLRLWPILAAVQTGQGRAVGWPCLLAADPAALPAPPHPARAPQRTTTGGGART